MASPRVLSICLASSLSFRARQLELCSFHGKARGKVRPYFFIRAAGIRPLALAQVGLRYSLLYKLSVIKISF